MAKLTTTNLTSLTSNEASAVSEVNANFDAVETAMEKTLSRDGTGPNSMDADFDMNGNDILNVGNIYFSNGGGIGSGGSGSGAGGGATGATGPAGATGPSFYTPATATVAAYQDFFEATNNGTNKVRITTQTSLASDVTVKFPSATGDIISTAESKNLVAGFTSTAFDAGTKTTGTFTPTPLNGNLQKVINNGAHTLAPAGVGSGDSTSLAFLYTNGTTPGTVTTSGFTKVNGAFTTVTGHKFMCFITIIAGFSYLSIVALQ